MLWRRLHHTTNNHCDRSWGDCSMAASGLQQVTNIFPVSVFVLGNCGCEGWWTINIACIAADDQNTITGWGSSIFCYPKNPLSMNILIPFYKIVQYLPITIGKWVVSSTFPNSRFIIQNFRAQSIFPDGSGYMMMSGYKWWVPVRSKRKDVLMRGIGWCFFFEVFSIKTRIIFMRSLHSLF